MYVLCNSGLAGWLKMRAEYRDKGKLLNLGRGGGLVASIHALRCDNPSSNPAGSLLYKKMKINITETRVGTSLKKVYVNF